MGERRPSAPRGASFGGRGPRGLTPSPNIVRLELTEPMFIWTVRGVDSTGAIVTRPRPPNPLHFATTPGHRPPGLNIRAPPEMERTKPPGPPDPSQKSGDTLCPHCRRGVSATGHPYAPKGHKFAECQRCRYFVLEKLMKAGRPLPRCPACKSGVHERHVINDTLILDTGKTWGQSQSPQGAAKNPQTNCAKLVCARCGAVALELPKDFCTAP